MIELINEKKFKNRKSNNDFFIMHFYQHELDKINFIISTLKNNYPDEELKFIFIVHIKRIMDKNKKEKIYSIPDIDEKVDQIFIDNLDIDEKVDQIFIDNLDGLDISLDDIAKKGIKYILENPKLVDKNNEFFKALKIYYNGYINKLNFIENYLPKITTYFENNKELVELILSKSIEHIYNINKKNDLDEEKENLELFNEIKKGILISQNTVDIISSIINDSIIEKRLRDTLMKVLDVLESNNFLTSLLNLEKNNNINNINSSFTSQKNIYQFMEKYLNLVDITDIKRKAIFCNDYMIPGLLPFYNSISNLISKNVAQAFFKNEKKLRDLLEGNILKSKNNFHLEESRLLDIVSKAIIDDESGDYKFFNEIFKVCPKELLLNDYIFHFINENGEIFEKNENGNKSIHLEELLNDESNIIISENGEEESKEEKYDDFYLNIINQIINLKYDENTEIIIENKNNELNKFLIKIIWLEANKNYILTIIKLFNEAKNIIYTNKNKKILIEQINNLIKNNKLKYITDSERNPEHTTEVNKCYYIILGALYLAITDQEKIVLNDPNNKKDFYEEEENQVKVNI